MTSRQIKDTSKLLNNLITGLERYQEIKFDQSGSNLFLQDGGKTKFLFRSRADQEKLAEAVDEIWKMSPEVNRTISSKTIREKIIDILVDKANANLKINGSDVESFFLGLLAIEEQEFSVFSQIYGIYSEEVVPYSIKGFSIYEWPEQIESITNEYPHWRKNLESDVKFEDGYVIGVKINARESQRAQELADDKFIRFENTLTFIIADLSRYIRVGILNFDSEKHRITTVLSKKYFQVRSTSKNFFRRVKIESPHYTSDQTGMNAIWDVMFKTNPNELERRAINSIEWIAKALSEPNYLKSMVEFVFAIEGLLQYNDKEPMQPSIGNQISEYAAFILKDDYESRTKFISNFKELYNKRSRIAHGGRIEITLKDLHSASDIARGLVFNLLTIDELKNIETIQGLKEWVDRNKFS